MERQNKTFDKLALLGGVGDFGAFYVKFFKNDFNKIVITGRDEQKGLKKARELEVDFERDNKKAVADADVVIVCTSLSSVHLVINEISHFVGENCLVVDFASVKEDAVKALQKIERNVEIASVHPMHGPRVKSIEGFPVVFITLKKFKQSKIDWLEGKFKNSGARIVESTAEEHDRMISVVQGLTHFSNFVNAAVLRELETDIKRSLEFASPNYELFLNLIARINTQNPELYAEIQTSNRMNGKMREVFLNETRKLVESCENNERLKEEICENSKIFKNIETYLFGSDKAVNSLHEEERKLMGKLNEKLGVENILNKKIHYGVLIKISENEITLKENSREVVLKKDKIRILDSKELEKFKKQCFRMKFLDYSFLTPKNVDESMVLDVFKNLGFEVKLIDKYDKFKDKKSITIRAEFFDDESEKDVDSKILNTIKGMGFELR